MWGPKQPNSLVDSVEKYQLMARVLIDRTYDSLAWVPEVAELPDESRCSHAEPLLETDWHQPTCSGAERDGKKEKSGGEQIKWCKLVSSSYVILERSHNDNVFCNSRTQSEKSTKTHLPPEQRHVLTCCGPCSLCCSCSRSWLGDSLIWGPCGRITPGLKPMPVVPTGNAAWGAPNPWPCGPTVASSGGSWACEAGVNWVG